MERSIESTVLRLKDKEIRDKAELSSQTIEASQKFFHLSDTVGIRSFVVVF